MEDEDTKAGAHLHRSAVLTDAAVPNTLLSVSHLLAVIVLSDAVIGLIMGGVT